MSPRFKRLLVPALGSLAGASIVLALVSWSLLNFASAKVNSFIYREALARPFNRTLWLRACTDKTLGTIRLQMVNDLINNHQMVGMNDSEVLSLIGGATVRGPIGEMPLDNNAWTYWLNREGFVSDSFYLTLRRVDGKVTSIAVWTD